MKNQSNFEKVREFNGAFGQPTGDTPMTPERMALRIELIREEFKEVLEEAQQPLAHIDHPALMKELADLLVVTYGMGVELGYPMDEAFNLVHASNMSKLGEDGKPIYREDGKVLKGPNYKKADLTPLWDVVK